MDLDQQIAELRDSSRRLVRALGFLGDRIDVAGCNALQCHSLIELSQRGRLNVRELSDLLEVDKSTASRGATELEREGLVEAVADPSDQRAKPLQLTERGRDRVRVIHERADDQVRRALELLDPAERESVLRGIALYERALHRSSALSRLIVRPIEQRDEPEMAQIIRSVMTEFAAVGCGFSIEDEEVDAMWRVYQQPRWRYFVVEQDGRLLGGAGIAPLEGGTPDVCELKKMYVLPAGRGLGVGRKLMDLSLDAAREAGFTRCYLETLGHMTQARHLYEKGGFRPIDGPMGSTGHFGCDHWYVREL